MEKRKVLMGIVILLPVVLLIVPSFAQPVLKIGCHNPRTGPGAYWGMSADDGVDLGVAAWNKKGGVTVNGKKYKIEVIHEDDKYSGAEAVKVVNKLIFTDKVKYIVGPLSAACVMSILPITEANKVITIVDSFAGSELLKDRPFAFRAMVPPIHSAPGFFKFVTKRFPGFKTCVHISPNDATGWGSTQGDNDACYAMGIKVLGSEFFERATEDFTPMLSRVIAQKPDFISFGGTPPGSAGLIIKQAKELGYKGMFIHTGHLPTSVVGPIAGWENIEGYLTSGMSLTGPACPPKVEEVGAEFAKKYGEDMFALGGLFYDYPIILFQGIEKANSFDTVKVRNAIENLGEWDSIMGKARWGGKEVYGQNHQIIAPFMISQAQKRRLICIGVEMATEVPPPQQKWR
jgi:branched-chain amino acid transport system substrate-binding protein